MAEFRSAGQLADVDEPAWPGLDRAFAERDTTQVLPLSRDAGLSVLHRLQVTARSALGALALSCGGVLLDSGWLRLLGGGSPQLPDLAAINGLGDPRGGAPSPPQLVVALDVLGGRFAIDGGGLGFEPGEVCYFGPDTLSWAPLNTGFGAFVAWAAAGGTEEFYADLRWPGWEAEVRSLRPDEGISCYPPLFSAEGADVASCSRRGIDFGELQAVQEDFARQIAALPDGSTFRIATRD